MLRLFMSSDFYKILIPIVCHVYSVSQELLAVFDYHVDREYRDSSGTVERRRSNNRNSTLRASIPYQKRDEHKNDESVLTYDDIGIAHLRSKGVITDPLRVVGSNLSSWVLPFRSECPSNHPEAIALEFKRLDINGEGRMTYLTLKSALELRGVTAADSTIRKWLKEADRGGKGYVDFSDYKSIYTDFEGSFNRDHRDYSVSPVRPVRGTSVSRIPDFSFVGGEEGEREYDRIELLRR